MRPEKRPGRYPGKDNRGAGNGSGCPEHAETGDSGGQRLRAQGTPQDCTATAQNSLVMTPARISATVSECDNLNNSTFELFECVTEAATFGYFSIIFTLYVPFGQCWLALTPRHAAAARGSNK